MKERTNSRVEKVEYVLEHRQPTLTVIIANIANEHNVSAIYRTCDAFGVMDIHLYYTHTPFPKISRTTSASSSKWVRTHKHDSPASIREALPNFQILSTQCSPQARPLRQYSYTQPTAILFGNEHDGVDKELLPYTDGEVYIPMYGMVQSFTVSVAAAIVLYECVRGREDSGMYATRQLSEEEFSYYREEWLKK